MPKRPMNTKTGQVFSLPRLAGALMASAFLYSGAALAEGDQPVVLELFTSQGCSSCPPADALLKALSERGDVVALSFHVDYWDHIGWKDPFSQRAFTERQQTYTRTLGARNLYTPQAVIDGGAHEVGSDKSRVMARINEARKQQKLRVALRREGGAVALHVEPPAVKMSTADPVGIYLAVYDRLHETPVRRGENSGATLKNAHVVRRFVRLSTLTEQPFDGTVPQEFLAAENDGIAVLVQPDKGGRILGAASLALKPDAKL